MGKTTQSLRRDLQGLASDLKWSVLELVRIADRLSLAGNDADAQAVINIYTMKQVGENWLLKYAHEDKSVLNLRSRSS